jgi:hypothetical protein
MRMDIEISPGAPAQLSDAAARDNWGHAFGDGGIQEKRCCSNGDFAIWREERVRRFNEERAGNVLRRHSSVNLVRPRPLQLTAAQVLRRMPKIVCAVSIPESARQQCRTGLFVRTGDLDSVPCLKFLLTTMA